MHKVSKSESVQVLLNRADLFRGEHCKSAIDVF